MPEYFAPLTILLMLGMVLARAMLLRRQGIAAIKFGQLDKSDFLIPPIALFYFYLVFAHAFGWPAVSTQEFFPAEGIAWVGVLFCAAGLGLLLWSLVSFGRSFRVGIDTEHPDKLITSGVFAFSRNPIYVAFALILLGQFLIFSNWILLVYFGAAIWLFHRQVLREEDYLKQHYGQEYVAFALILLGQFLIFSNWILLVYFGAAIWLFHRQVLREEDYLKQHYGQEYVEYGRRVRRYL